MILCDDDGGGDIKVATGPWKKYAFFQDLESPWKPNRVLKVLECGGRGLESRWMAVVHNQRFV